MSQLKVADFLYTKKPQFELIPINNKVQAARRFKDNAVLITGEKYNLMNVSEFSVDKFCEDNIHVDITVCKDANNIGSINLPINDIAIPSTSMAFNTGLYD